VIARRMLAPAIVSLLLVGGALAAGCGGGDEGSSGGGGGAAASSEPAGGATTESAGGAARVTMKNISFQPGSLTVKAGEKVEWVNEDSAPHNVVSTKGEKIKSKTFGKGGTFSFTPKQAGTIEYVCTIHPGMQGKLVVGG
jgi:plastocyanin